MKFRYTLFSAIALGVLGGVQTVYSQIDRNVEVVKAYVPNIEPTDKLALVPDMSDDSYIMPDIDYSITPVSVESTFDLTHYKASTMNFTEYTSYPHYYLKLGAGLPLQSVVDLYASSFNVDQSFVMGYFNQSGRYANIDNDFGVEHSGSSQSHFRGGVAAGTYVGQRGKMLRGELRYRSDLWSRYATMCDSDYSHPLYQSGGAQVEFGDDFVSLSGVDYALRGGVNYFWDRADYSSTSYNLEAQFAGMIGSGKLLGSVGFEGISAADGSISNSTFTIGANYSKYGEKFRFEFGAKYYGDDLSLAGSAEGYIVPRLMLDYNIASTKFVGYVDLDGGLLYNDFGGLSEVNPYLALGSYGDRNTMLYDLDLGLKGAILKGALSYNVYFDYDITTANRYWTFVGSASELNNYFVLSLSDMTKVGASVELEYIPRSNTTIRLEASLANYIDNDAQIVANGMASGVARLSWEQRLGKLSLTLLGDYRSSREVTVMDSSTLEVGNRTLGAEFDMGVSLNYRLSDRFFIFGDVRNIFNADIYDWAYYREYGVNFMAGIKVQF
ncbi:MAG: hypothetical protein SNH63_03745 [Rikenellaceae bacterium]